MNEKVSICIPAYNNEKEIAVTIQRIIKQTYTNWELIIVDDASTDNTVSIIKQFSDPRIKLYQNEQNLGMVGNWNRCVKLCTADYIKLVCADDVLRNESLEKEMPVITSNPEIVMTVNDSIMINRKHEKLGLFGRYPVKGFIDGKKLAKRSLILNNFFGMPCAVLFRKSAFDQAGGFDERFQYILDFDLWLTMAQYGQVAVLPEKLNYFMLREDSNTGKVLSKENKAYYEEHVSLLNKHAKSLGVSKCGVLISKISRQLRSFAYGIWLKRVLAK